MESRREMRRAWNFLKEFAWPFGFCGAAYTIAVRFIPQGATVTAWALLGYLTFLVALVITLVGYIIREVPKSGHAYVNIEQALDGARLLLIAKNEIFGVNMGANIYFREGKYERLIGQATVETIQSDGITQLRVNYVSAVEPELLLKISQNVPSTLSSIIVRGGIIMEHDSGLGTMS